MAKTRMVKAEIRSDEKVNSWPIQLRYFWVMLWGYADDYGRGRSDPRLIKADGFPLDDEVNAETVSRWMRGLAEAGVIRFYEVGGHSYFEIPHWSEHQKLSRPAKSNIPAPPTNSERPHVVAEQLHASDLQSRAEGEGEGEREGEKKGRGTAQSAAPPRTCPQHPHGTDAPCGACKEARLAYEQWQKRRPSVPMPPDASRVLAEQDQWAENAEPMPDELRQLFGKAS